MLVVGGRPLVVEELAAEEGLLLPPPPPPEATAWHRSYMTPSVTSSSRCAETIRSFCSSLSCSAACGGTAHPVGKLAPEL